MEREGNYITLAELERQGKISYLNMRSEIEKAHRQRMVEKGRLIGVYPMDIKFTMEMEETPELVGNRRYMLWPSRPLERVMSKGDITKIIDSACFIWGFENIDVIQLNPK